MENAIKKAIEGGYKNAMGGAGVFNSFELEGHPHKEHLTNIYLLDPLFWQALGKAEGWGLQTITINCKARVTSAVHKEGVRKYSIPAHSRTLTRNRPMAWKKNWHKFIDHLADGKSVGSFFEELLTTN